MKSSLVTCPPDPPLLGPHCMLLLMVNKTASQGEHISPIAYLTKQQKV
jgi:hypothetical protein